MVRFWPNLMVRFWPSFREQKKAKIGPEPDHQCVSFAPPPKKTNRIILLFGKEKNLTKNLGQNLTIKMPEHWARTWPHSASIYIQGVALRIDPKIDLLGLFCFSEILCFCGFLKEKDPKIDPKLGQRKWLFWSKSGGSPGGFWVYFGSILGQHLGQPPPPKIYPQNPDCPKLPKMASSRTSRIPNFFGSILGQHFSPLGLF